MIICNISIFFFFQAEDGIRDVERSRGLGDVYKRQSLFYFITLILLYFVTSQALLSIGMVGETYVRRVREKLFRHMSSLDINYFEKNKTGVLVARLTSDMQSLNEFAREGASSVITALLTIFGAVVAVFLVDVQLSILAFVIMPILAIATKIFRNYADNLLGGKRVDRTSAILSSGRHFWCQSDSSIYR